MFHRKLISAIIATQLNHNLMPGTYLFYYLPRSGIALSAQKLAIDSEAGAEVIFARPEEDLMGSPEGAMGSESLTERIRSVENPVSYVREVQAQAIGSPSSALEANHIRLIHEKTKAALHSHDGHYSAEFT